MSVKANHSVDDELGRLKACINDLTSLLALPAIWTGGESHQIIAALLDVLMGVLRLDAVYAEIKDPVNGAFISMRRPVLAENRTKGEMDIKQVLNDWLQGESRGRSVVLKRSGDNVSIVPLHLGFPSELGWIVATSRRADFPTQTERLLLSVATNQATIGLHEARLLSEQKRVATELEEKVAERTRELQELKDQLQRENVVLREQVDEASMFEEIVGTAPVLRLVLSRVAKVAPTDCTVLITGETGTGKELIARAWPGNIRELQNVIERSLILCETESFSVDENWLTRKSFGGDFTNGSLGQRLTTDERALIEAALAETRGRVSGRSGAAAKLGLPASTLESKIRSLRINKHAFKTS